MRKTYPPEFKAKLVMEVFKGERLLNEIASENNVHPNMLIRWKTEAANNLHVLFENENAKMRKQAKQYDAQMPGLNRTSLYYKPHPSSEWDLQLNRLIDITYTKHP